MPAKKYEYSISKNILQWIMHTVQFDAIPSPVADNIIKWANGEKEPTFNQIEQASKATGIPLGYFFLQTPPQEDIPLMKYRTINSVSFDRPSRNLIETIHDMELIQDWTKDYMQAEGLQMPECVGAFKKETDIKRCADIARKILKIEKDWFLHNKTPEESYRFIRNAISDAGVIVMMNGVVGNNTHRSLDIEEFRAFAMTDMYAPLIFINTNDSVNGRLFSLLHEFAHVCVGENDFFNDRHSNATNINPVEVLCNAVAAELLVPQEIFLKFWNEKINKNIEVETIIEELAKDFRCGITVIARKALDNKKISGDLYNKIATRAIKLYTDKRKREKEKGIQGGDFYRTVASRIDKRFFLMLANSVSEGRTLYGDAFRLTNTNRTTFSKLVLEQMGGV